MEQVEYKGQHDPHGGAAKIEVCRGGVCEPLTHHIHHSPDGFAYGYGGSGPAELARCILWDYLGQEPSPGCYQAFKQRFIATADGDAPFSVNGSEIQAFLENFEGDWLAQG